jgi:hypothetical protein
MKILHREKVYDKLTGEYAEVLATYRATKESLPDTMPMRGMAFCTSHEECEEFVKDAKEHGLKCRIVTGKEAKGRKGQKVINEAVDALDREEIDLIVTVEKLATGFNRPEINAVIWARITSAAKTIQGIGRGGRSHNYPGDIRKEHCLVFETNWSLQGNSKRKKKALRLADALAANGEEPEAICGMLNREPLQYEKPITKEQVAEEIRERYAPETWAIMKATEKKGLSFAGRGYGNAIAALFGVKGNPTVIHALHLAIGREVWGECETLKVLDKEKMRELILMQKHTPETWAAMKVSEKHTLRLDGKIYGMAIATLFGVKGDPAHDHALHLAIGREVWGDLEVLREPEQANVMREQIVKEMQKYAPETWAAMKVFDKRKLTFRGKGYGMAIAALFELKGNPVEHHALHLAIGREVWGECETLKVLDKEKMRELILMQKHTPETWAAMQQPEKEKLIFGGKRYGMAIATLFGLKGKPAYNHALHLAIGREVWGDLEVLREPEKVNVIREQVEEAMKADYTSETWAAMKRMDKEKLYFGGKNYGMAIATLFGVKGDPLKKHVLHLAIGREVWGECEGLKPLDKEKMQELILMQKHIPETWAAMKRAEKEKLRFDGKSYGMAIAKLFDVKGDPVKNHAFHLAIGRAIWGDHPALAETQE